VKLKPGVQRMFDSVYAPRGWTIAGASIFSSAFTVDGQLDEKCPVARLQDAIDPRATVSMTVYITALKVGTKVL
jgi:hypothetical protein